MKIDRIPPGGQCRQGRVRICGFPAAVLSEPDLLTEERGHGPLTERVVSALIPMHDVTEWKGVKAAEEAMEGRPGTNGAAAAAARDKLNVADLEERMKVVMRHHGLLEEIVRGLVLSTSHRWLRRLIAFWRVALQPDYSEAVDDPIATALRHAQRLRGSGSSAETMSASR